MVSRKKAKGQARKAAKAKAEESYAMFKPFSLTQFKKSSCTHGWNHDAYASSHDCYKFVEAVMEAFRRNKGKFDIFDAPKEATLHKYPEIWGDPTKFEWVASAFVSIGVEVLIRQDDKVGKLILSVYSIAYSEWIHQHVACALHKSVPAMYMARLNDLMHADQRRVISYLKKRIPCSCLNVLYDRVKHLPKKGLCGNFHCSSNKVELSKMWSCEGCLREHYCSVECQAADWSRHRETCKVWSEWEATEDAESSS
eukprot:scaffold1170_cov139-Skeletonema_dohrnii-CCMP3373.AAC.8